MYYLLFQTEFATDDGGINSTTAAVVAPADEASKDETMSPDAEDTVVGNIKASLEARGGRKRKCKTRRVVRRVHPLNEP